MRLVHPLLDRPEGMLDDFASAVENLWPRLESLGHTVHNRLVFQTRDLAIVLRAAGSLGANQTRGAVVVAAHTWAANPAHKTRDGFDAWSC